MNLLSTFTLLCLGLGQLSLTTVNFMVDPNRLTWWRTKWSPGAIQLSVNNKGRSGVTVSFLFTPTTAVLNGILEVTFPAGFAVVSYPANAQTADGQVVQVAGQSYTSGADYLVSVQGVTNPTTSGPYGPFALRTRYNAGGQQVDVNLSFGTVYICGDPGTLGSLGVSLAGTSIKNAINKSGNTLSFKFTIGVTLWRYDTFVISIDPRWTVSTGLSCSSADYVGKVNNFNGTNAANPHSLECVASSKVTATTTQQVYVYGLATDETELVATPDNKFVDLRVSGVTTPGIVTPTNPYSWTVQTFRFGTATMLETASQSTGPEVVADTIGAALWIPTWGTSPSDLVPTSAYFMDLSFTLTNKVPTGGTIEVVVSEDVATGDVAWTGNAPNNCYLVINIGRATKCVITAPSTITLTNFPDLAAGTMVKMRNVVKITTSNDGSAKVVTIRTFGVGGVTGGYIIDSGASLGTFKVSSNTATQIANFSILFQDSTSTTSAVEDSAGGTGDYTQGVQFVLVPSPISDVGSTSAFTIACPFTPAVDDFSIGVPSNDFVFKDSSTVTAIDMVTGLTALTTNKPTLTVNSGVSTLGSIKFTGNIGTIASGVHLLMTQSASVTAFITLPRVVNNFATAYECSASIQTSGKPTHRGAVRFQVIAQAWLTNTFSLPCSTQVDGVPAMFAIKPAVLAVGTSSAAVTYYVEIELPGTAGLNCGLTVTPVNTPNNEDVMNFAVSYPVERSTSDTLTAKMYTNGAYSFVAVTGFTSLSPASSADTTLYIPIGGQPESTYTPRVRSYYILAADPRYKFITHEEDFNVLTFLKATDPLPFPIRDVIAASNTLTAGEISTSNLKMDLKVSVVVATDHYFYFMFPPGFGWSSSPSVINADSTIPASIVYTPYTSVKFFSSPAASFRFAGALVYARVGSAVMSLPDSSNAMTETINFRGLKVPLSSGTQYLVAVLGAATQTADCGNVSNSIVLQSIPGTIKALSISPATSKSRGPDG